MRSFLNLQNLVIVSSLAVVGLFTIRILAMEGGLDSPEDESSNLNHIDFPICNKKIIPAKELLLVSTLDGKLSAIDPKHGGSLWSVATGPGSMLSSTIQDIEITGNKLVRLIPSLAGGLYKFDGEVIERVPLSAEELLSTSFKFADNTVMTGGKESRVYGIELSTGRIKYECTMSGCFEPSGEPLKTNADSDLEDLIVVKRETQVVRAVEPRTGSEKWNFSVSTHHVSFQSGLELEDLCNDTIDEDYNNDDSELLKAVVPEGVICKVDKKKPDKVIWKQMFNSPIVHAWKLINGDLVAVDLFSNSHLPKSDFENGNSDPSLYIGSYQKQLYIQESDELLLKRKYLKGGKFFDEKTGEMISAGYASHRVKWRPYLISADSRTTVINHGSKPKTNELPMLTYDPNTAENTAITVFKHGGGNADYPYDSGLYFYPDEPTLDYDLIEDITKNNLTHDDNTNANEDDEKQNFENTTPDDIIEEIPNPIRDTATINFGFVSIWYWWQEIALISLFTAFMMNLLITRPYIQGLREGFRRRLQQIRFQRRPDVLIVERRIEVPTVVEVEVPVRVPNTPPETPGTGSTDNTTISFSRSASLNSNNPNQEFVSRYLTDYEPVQCLGSGGFGVVFESKNKLDENSYAVKRIKLPMREEAKKKVMREVKCLARLDNRNIVRYYTTWLENPPHGWQEEVDKQFKTNLTNNTQNLSASFNDDDDVTNAENPLKPFDTLPKSATDLNSLDCDYNYNDDSFKVVFEAGTDDDDENDEENEIEEDITDVSDDDGIIFKDETKDELVSKPPPSRSISIVSMTQSKFWKDISDEENEDEAEECCEALIWDAKNQSKKAPPAPVYLYIVMQLCQKESLRVWLKNTSEHRSRLESLSRFHEICSGVEYVHSQGLIHRDLKPSNIFFANDGTLKIGDFGLATVGYNAGEDDEEIKHNKTLTPQDMREGHTEEVGTELYMSPEQVEKKPYNHKVDIYSLGLILFELLVPFKTQMERIDTMTKLKKLEFPKEFIDQPECKLVKSMLEHDPGKRPEALGILNMDFLCQALDDHEAIQFINAGHGDFHHHHGGSQRRRKHLSSGGGNGSSIEHSQ